MLGEQFGIGRSTVSDILHKREAYKAQWEENQSSKRQCLNKPMRLNSLNSLLFDFFCKVRSKSIPISWPILQKKALEFAEELEIDDFQASNGWLTNWKSRYNIKQFVISGESADVDPEVVAEFKDRLSSIIAGYDPKDTSIVMRLEYFTGVFQIKPLHVKEILLREASIPKSD